MAGTISTKLAKTNGASDWATDNSILDEGEIGTTTDTGVLKIGDGTTRWNSLPGINQQIAHIDFTGKTDGAAPIILDTGQSATTVFNNTGRRAVISGGRLVVDTPPVSGSLADYYQVNIGAASSRVGLEWTQPSGADNGEASAVIIAWASEYQGGTVPKCWCHITITPGTGTTGTAQWWVSNGTADSFRSIKSQEFVNPADDGETRWRCDAVLDVPSGKGYARLPDGSIMTLTNAEIAAFCVAVAITPFTFEDIGPCPVICCEHFANANASTAKFGGFTAFWGESESSIDKPWTTKTATLLDGLKTAEYLDSLIPPLATGKTYAPTTALVVATTTSAANVDATNAVVTCKAGPSGIILFTITSYYEFTNTDRVFWRLVLNGGIGATALRIVCVGTTGNTLPAYYMEAVSGLVPGQEYTATLQHSAVTGARATLRAGGSAGTMSPPLTFHCVPA